MNTESDIIDKKETPKNNKPDNLKKEKRRVKKYKIKDLLKEFKEEIRQKTQKRGRQYKRERLLWRKREIPKERRTRQTQINIKKPSKERKA